MQSRWLTEQIRHGANSNSSGSSNGATAAKFAVGDECPRQNQFEATPCVPGQSRRAPVSGDGAEGSIRFQLTRRGLWAPPLPLASRVETRSTALEAIAAKGEADGGFGFVEMEDFAPQIFAQIRALYGIETDSYVRSCARARHAKLSGGSSGAFFFQSHDERFVVKSMTRQECLVLCRILPTYLEHLRANPQSLLVRIYSCHCIHIYRSKIYFVVMDNIFAKAKPLHEHYDLKARCRVRLVVGPSPSARGVTRHRARRRGRGWTDRPACSKRSSGADWAAWRRPRATAP